MWMMHRVWQQWKSDSYVASWSHYVIIQPAAIEREPDEGKRRQELPIYFCLINANKLLISINWSKRILHMWSVWCQLSESALKRERETEREAEEELKSKYRKQRGEEQGNTELWRNQGRKGAEERERRKKWERERVRERDDRVLTSEDQQSLHITQPSWKINSPRYGRRCQQQAGPAAL